VDDLGVLRPMWEAMRWPVQDFEKRLTEFQVAEDASGKIVGAIGFQMAGRQARIHGESYPDFSVADAVRPLFWDRIQVLLTNHGIVRLWTQEHAPFWKQHGMTPAGPEPLKKLPEAWTAAPGQWHTLKLKDEESLVSLEKELAMFMEAEKQRTSRAFHQARVLKFVAMLLAVAFAVFVVVAVILLIRNYPGLTSGR